VLLLALAVMPLQGTAATLSALLCDDEAQTHAMHDPSGHDQGMHHDGHSNDQQDTGGAIGNSAYHPCCHYTVSALAAVTLLMARPDSPVGAFAPDALHDLFVPDRPQRPPLA